MKKLYSTIPLNDNHLKKLPECSKIKNELTYKEIITVWNKRILLLRKIDWHDVFFVR